MEVILMRENIVDKKIIKDLENTIVKESGPAGLCGTWWKNQGNTYQPSGRPDYMALIDSHFYAIEAKAGNGHQLGVAQLMAGYRITASGGIFIVAYPDYTTLSELTKRAQSFNNIFNQPLSEAKATLLPYEQYQELSDLCSQINVTKKTRVFVK